MKLMRTIGTISLAMVAMVAMAAMVTTTFKVEGQCEMCKEKIENALDVKGVSFAEWNVETKMLTVKYDNRKINEDQIHTIISDLGYSTSKLEADKDAQAKLDKCCQPKKNGKACCASH